MHGAGTMRHFILSLLVVMIALVSFQFSAQAQDLEDMMKQLEEQGISEEDLQKMMQSMGTMMPSLIEAGTYTHPEQGYSVDIPEGWTGSAMGPALIVFEGTMMQEAFSPESKAFIIFKQTEEEITATFRGQNINEINIDDFRAEVKKAMREQAGSDEIEIKKIERTKVNGQDAFHVLQRFKPNDPNMPIAGWMMAEMFVFQNGSDHLNIVYMSPEDNWSEYESFTSKHIKSFKF
jgi:uncharacterized protein YneF (UPF0154 family)